MLKKKTVVLAAYIALSVISVSAHAYIGLCCGKCGGNMPMNIPGGGIPETYELRLKLSPMFMHMSGLQSGTQSISPDSLLGMPMMGTMPTGKYMAVPTSMDMNMANLSVGYSFTEKFFGGVMFMYKQNSMNMKFNSMMQSSTGVSGFTMKSQGLADTMLMSKYLLYADDPLIPRRESSLFFGLSLPTGSIDTKNANHPVAMRQKELNPYGMQLGSGTMDPTVGVLYQGRTSPYWWGVNATYTARLYNNKRNYRLGDEAHLDLYGMYQLNYATVAQLQLNAVHQGAIRGTMDSAASGASGHVTQGDPLSPYTTPLWNTANYGGDTVWMTAGMQWQPAPLWILDLQGGIPLVQRLNGVQVKQSYRVMFTIYREIPTSRSIRYAGATGPGKVGF